MEKLKVYLRKRDQLELESILVNDENKYEMNTLMRMSFFRQFIVTELLMMRILEEYFILQGYELLEFFVRDAATNALLKSYVEDIKKDRVLFYKLWSWDFEYGYIDRIVLKKGEDIFEMNSSGQYTNSELHRNIVHRVILEVLNEVN